MLSVEITGELIELGAIAMAGGRIEWEKLPPMERHNVRVRFSRGLHTVLAKLDVQPPTPAGERFGLSPAQTRVFNFLRDFIAKNGHSPSFQQIQSGLKFKSRGHITEMLNRLEQRGYIRRMPRRANSIEIVERQ